MNPVVALYYSADESGVRLLKGQGTQVETLPTARADAFDDIRYQVSKGARNRAAAGPRSFGHDTKSAAEIARPRLAKHVMHAREAEC